MPSKYKCQFKANQIVVFEVDKKWAAQYPFELGERVLFLGEIKQMPGHCIVVNKAGRVLWGYHTDDFREPKENEL